MFETTVEHIVEKLLQGQRILLPHIVNDEEASKFLNQLRVRRSLLDKKLEAFGAERSSPNITFSFEKHPSQQGYIFLQVASKRRRRVNFQIILDETVPESMAHTED